MPTQLLVYEQLVLSNRELAPVLITVVSIDNAHGQIIKESHVFIPAIAVHLHEVNYRAYDQETEPAIVACSVESTRGLLTDYVKTKHYVSGLALVRGGQPEFRQLAQHPFHSFKLRNQFVNEMWEIQEWTTSAELRGSLAEVLSYRCDQKEADLLDMIFGEDESEASDLLPTIKMNLLTNSYRQIKF